MVLDTMISYVITYLLNRSAKIGKFIYAINLPKNLF
jgi:hypothetical protein